MSETPTIRMRRIREIAEEVRIFADAEAAASGLPGAQGGPRDAYRHFVGAGELRRRLGATASTCAGIE